MCIHTHAQNRFGLRARGKQGILVYFTEDNADTFYKGKIWDLKPQKQIITQIFWPAKVGLICIAP